MCTTTRHIGRKARAANRERAGTLRAFAFRARPVTDRTISGHFAPAPIPISGRRDVSTGELRLRQAATPCTTLSERSRQRPHQTVRFTLSRFARAACLLASSLAGIPSPLPKTISSGVCPENAA